MQHILIESTTHSKALAKRFAACIPPPPLHVHLSGDLGVGKTFWVREVIAALGGERATSPTFAWAISYPTANVVVHHMDLFRLKVGTPPPDEILELLDDKALCMIEWSERTTLPPPDVCVSLSFGEENVNDDERREMTLTAMSDKGKKWVRDFCG